MRTDPRVPPAPVARSARGRFRARFRWYGLLALLLGALAACSGQAAPASSRHAAAGHPVQAAKGGGGTAAASGAAANGGRGAAAGEVSPGGSGPLAGGALLIADRYNHRLLLVDERKRILWSYRFAPLWAGNRPADGPDDAFFTPGYGSIITNEEDHHVIAEIDPVSGRVLWHYGHPGVPGAARGYLNGPDDAYRLSPKEARLAGVPQGTTTVADIRNCRILFIAPDGRVVRQIGTTGACLHRPPRYLASPNGDTPLPDGGMLVTEIGGSHVLRLSPRGQVLWDLKLPGLTYPSDAQLLPDGSILVAGYTDPGQVLRVTTSGKVLWRYAPVSGAGRLRLPSLAIRLPNGLVAVNDDADHRVVVIDPASDSIVWQFGVTGVPGDDATHLDVPDGMNWVPASVAARLAAGAGR
ncbi:MAG: PQQ-binding-like beta-propeller repeat protein [Bacillota bacterium]|nr:PQQ-binding-like beta-propeller repeat protein [Bacillota bacterium]